MRFVPRFLCSVLLLAPATLAKPQANPQPVPQSDPPTQSEPTATPPPPANYTLQTGTHLVLTDVLVSDRSGNPIHGLPAHAFHITEDGKPQNLGSLEEHRSDDPAQPAAVSTPSPHSDTYSNNFLLHPPPVLNILVLDTTNIPVEDQMYLSFQLTQFLKTFPAGASLAIYGRSGVHSVLLQNFTSDRALLLAAVTRTLPRLLPIGRQYLSDLATLQQISDTFGDLPGRKNIIWFTGGSTLFLRPDATAIPNYDRWRQVYDRLESSRIAIFPVDARGLTTYNDDTLTRQHFLMGEVATATGGTAYFNTNGLKEIAAHLTSIGGDFYTVTYSPRNYREDRKWHKVAITVNGNAYTLSYRRGYFADGFNAREQSRRSGISNRLLADGGTVPQDEVSNLPIIFQARVTPAADLPASVKLLPLDRPLRGNEALFAVRYTIPVKELTFSPATASGNSAPSVSAAPPDPGQQQVHFLAAAFAFNRDGTVVDGKAERITITVSPAEYQLISRVGLPLQQQLRLHHGDNFLMLAVADPITGRAGRIQLTLTVPTH